MQSTIKRRRARRDGQTDESDTQRGKSWGWIEWCLFCEDARSCLVGAVLQNAWRDSAEGAPTSAWHAWDCWDCWDQCVLAEDGRLMYFAPVLRVVPANMGLRRCTSLASPALFHGHGQIASWAAIRLRLRPLDGGGKGARDMRDQTSRARPSTQQREAAGTARLPPASHCLDAGEWRIESPRDKAAQRLDGLWTGRGRVSERSPAHCLSTCIRPSICPRRAVLCSAVGFHVPNVLDQNQQQCALVVAARSRGLLTKQQNRRCWAATLHVLQISCRPR